MDLSLVKDLVDLARNGYKPSDVKDLLTMMKEDPEKKEDPGKKEDPEKKEDPDKKELVDAFAKLVEENNK